MRRVLSLFLAILMVLSTCMVGAVSVNATTDTGSTNTDTIKTDSANVTYQPKLPEGTAGVDYTEIKTADDFAALKDATAESVYVLTADITISASVAEFKGTLYGNGKTITTSVPVFTALTGATVYDLTIKGTINNTAADSVVGALASAASDTTLEHVVNEAPVSGAIAGGLVAQMSGASTLKDCVNKGAVTASGSYAGGIAAIVTSPSVQIVNCVNLGAVTAIGDAAGGILGCAHFESSGTLTVQSCVNAGAVTSASEAGGIIGSVTGNVTVTNCSVHADVTSTAGYVGGIVAYVTAAETIVFDRCIVASSMTGTSFVGGIVGYIDGGNTITKTIHLTNCTSSGTITTNGGVGGIVGYVINSGALSSFVIDGCKSTCSITTNGGDAGGIIGTLGGAAAGATVRVTNSIYAGSKFVAIGAGDIGGIAGVFSSGTAHMEFSSCVVISDITSTDTKNKNYCGGIIGSSWSDHAANLTIENCFLYGSFNATIGGNAHYFGGLFGYRSAGQNVVHTIKNNAIYLDLTGSNSPKITAFGGYANTKSASTKICYNLFVGSVTPQADGISVLAQTGNSHLVNRESVKDNYYFRTDGKDFDVAGSSGSSSHELNADYDHKIVSEKAEKADVSATLNTKNGVGEGDPKVWTYITKEAPVVVNGVTLSEMNIPVTALQTLTNSSSASVETITNEADFLAMKPNGNYKLGENIKLTSSYGLPFFGTLDGDGKTITIEGAPVFCELGSATVKNLRLFGTAVNENEANVGALALEAGNVVLDSITFAGGYVEATNNAGGLIGQVNGNATVTNCSVHADVTSTAGYVGGIVAYVTAAETIVFDRCIVASSMTGTSFVGGIVGYIDGGNTITKTIHLTNCTSSGTITTNGGVGGIVGYVINSGALSSFVIDGCKSTCSITTNGGDAGGIIGTLGGAAAGATVRVTNSIYAGSKFVAIGAGDIGGIAGVFSSGTAHMEFSSCVVISDITSTDTKNKNYCGGIIGSSWSDHAANLTIENCFLYGSFNATIGGNAHYFGGLFGYRSAGQNVVHTIKNNAIYLDLTGSNSPKITAFGGYANTKSASTKICYNLFVGSVTPQADGISVLAQTGNSHLVNRESVKDNYYFRTDGKDFDVAGSSGSSSHELNADYDHKIVSEKAEKADVSATLNTKNGVGEGDPKVWTYIDGFRIGEEVLFFNIPVSAWNVLVAAKVGTLSTEINNEAEFHAMDPDGYYKLADSFELTQSYTGGTFTGILDGNDKTITVNGKPVFESLDNALVYDLNLTGSVASTEEATVGALASTAKDSILLNVDATALTVTSVGTAGGLVGSASGSFDARNCNVAGTVTATKGYAGGILATTAAAGTDLTFTDCSFNGAASAATKDTGAGGIYGGNADNMVGDLVFTSCVTSGTVTLSSGFSAGGIAGIIRKPATFTATNCSSTSTISAEIYGGGIVGAIVGGATTIENCSYNGTLTATRKAGGIVAYFPSASSVTIRSCRVGGSVTGASEQTGGIVGCTTNTTNTTIDSCFVTGTVSGSGVFGGIIGNATNQTDGGSFVITSCVYAGQQDLKSGGDTGGIVGVFKSAGTAGTFKIEGCSVVSNIISSAYRVAGIAGNLEGNSKSKIGFVVTKCFVFGSISTTYSGNSLRHAGIAGYVYNGNPGTQFSDNAVYADIIAPGNTESVSAFAGYGNHGNSGSYIKNNVYVGTIVTAPSAVTVLATTRGGICTMENEVVVGHNHTLGGDRSNNHYYRTDGKAFDYMWYANCHQCHGAIGTETVAMTSATQNATSTLGSSWTYVSDYLINGLPFTGNIPKAALNVLETVDTTIDVVDKTGPVIITDEDGFLNMDPNGYYKLGADIVLTTPYYTKGVFAGILDGDGFKVTSANGAVFAAGLNGAFIYDLVVEASVSTADITSVGALAPTANDVTLLNIEATVTVSGSKIAGGLVGTVSGDVYVNHCTVSGTVTGESAASEDGLGVGGLFGKGETTKLNILNCVSNVTVNGQYRVGGVIGNVQCSGTVNIYNCKSTADVTLNKTGTAVAAVYVGGIVGYVDSSELLISSSIASGNVTLSGSADSMLAGGIIGAFVSSADGAKFTASNCAFVGTKLVAPSTTGGIAGQVTAASALECNFVGCVVASTIEIGGSGGGIVGTSSNYASYADNNKSYLGIDNCFVLGTIKTTDDGNYFGGLFGYQLSGKAIVTKLTNNSVYADLIRVENGARISLLAGYANSYNENNVFENNVFVGSTTNSGGLVTVFINGSGYLMNAESASNNYYYVNGAINFHAAYAHSDGGKSLPISGVSNLYTTTPTENLVAKLGDKFSYVDGYRVGEHVLVGNIPTAAWEILQETNAGEYATKINSADGFLNMEADGYYKLTADIKIPSSYANAFSGILDGNGKKITVSGNAPVFSSLENATVYDLAIEATVENAEAEFAGALAPTANGVELYNVTAKVNVSAAGLAGGLIGKATGSVSIIDCSVTGTVTSTASYAGGVVGMVENSPFVILADDSFLGTVSASGRAGGIVGSLDLASHSGTVIGSCSVIGSVSGDEFVGGIAGYIVSTEGAGRSLKVENCLFVGDIISRSKAGGIVGQVDAAAGALWSNVSFNSNVVLGSMSSAHYAGGIVGDVRGWDGSATFDSNFVNLDRWLSTYTGGSPQYVGGLWGYSRDKKPIKVTNNGLYFNLESCGHSFQAIGGYANGNDSGTTYSNNLFVGSAVLNTINKYSDSQVIKALYHRGGGTMLTADKLQTNYYFFGNDTFDGAISVNAGTLIALDDTRDVKMSSATENVSAALGSAWTYAENLVFGSRVFTGNVPAAAYALLESNGIVAATTATPIYDADDFLNMDSFGSYVLMNNITLNSSYELPFYGYLDGNEKTIFVNGKPVFESVSSATIVDLTVDGLISDTESTYVGAIANTAASVNLENVTVDVDVEAAGCAGGFFGTVTNVAKLNKITNKGDVTSAKMAGGILGYSTNNASVTYTECSNEGDVTGYSFAGGIVPFVSADTKFVKCSNSGNVKTIYDFTAAEGETIKFMGFAGGITAYAGSTVTVDGVISSVASDNDRSKVCNPKNYSEFVECSNSGNVTGMHYVGGILGATFDSAKFEYCSNEKNAVISGSDDSRLYVGGITGAVFVEGYFYRCDNAGEVYGNAMTGGIAGASGLSTTHIGPFGGQRFIGCTHTGLVSVTQVVGISDDVARVPGGIAGYCRSIRPYRAIVFDYCAVSGEIVLNRTEGCTSGTVAGVLVATVSSLDHAEFKYNYFTGKISVNGAGFTLFLPYQDSTQVPAENLEGNYSVKVGGLYYGFDKTGLIEFADDAIIKTKFADGSINYEKLLTILNESFDGQEVFVIDEDLQIAVLNKEYDVSKQIPEEAKPIGTAEEFLAMDPYGNYYLTADITLDSTYEYVFGGILNGDGYTITTSAPIFEAVEGAFIYDLTIDGSIEAEAMNVGALVNFADGIILNNVTNNADVLNKIGVSSDTDYTKATGGLVGKAVGTVTLTNCRNNGTITGAMPGGLVGSATNATFTATDCVNAGELTNYSTKVAVAGGILAFGDTGSFTFTGCYNTADLLFATATAYKVYAGGMLGFVRGADVELVVDDCANGGLVIANGTVGGIVGLAIGLVKSEFTDCENAGRVVSKGDFAGGIAAWVSNSTDVSEINANGNSSVTHYFTNCSNVADVYSFGRFAAGILTVTLDGAKFEYCLNSGDITTGAGNWGYSHATGIVTWTGARTDVYYCVNTGDITGAANAAGIGGYFYNIEDSADYHIVTGCVNTGNILSLYPSANIDRDAAVGIVRRARSSSLKINGCVVAGSVKSVNGNAYGLFYYANSGKNNVSGNVILLGPDDVSGVNTYLVASKANTIALDPENNKPAQLYVREGVFETFAAHDDTVIPMPSDYAYFFTDDDLTDGDLLKGLNACEIEDFLSKNSFVLNDGMPMHKSVVDVYGLKDSEAEDFIPEELIPEETPEEEEPEDTETSEPESSDTVEPESSETEPESSEVVDPGNDTTTEPGSSNTTEPEDDTTKAPADDTTKGDNAGTEKPDDGKKKGCGSVVSATLALAAIALIAPAMVVIKKKDEE